MKAKTYFVTGISTEVGKTVASAVITQALQADYWKPVQAGDLENTDSHKVARWVSNKKTVIHPSTYELNTPMSPHAAADIDGVNISLERIKRPKTTNRLVIEGAGGLLVPLNNTDTIVDLILPDDHVIMVSRHYLGSINHTLLSVEALKTRGYPNVHLLFVGNEHPTTEAIILRKTGLDCIGRIDEQPSIDSAVIDQCARKLKTKLLSL